MTNPQIELCFFSDSGTHTTCFKQVNIGRVGVWAVTDGGSIVRRLGICPSNPAGSGWDIFPTVSDDFIHLFSGYFEIIYYLKHILFCRKNGITSVLNLSTNIPKKSFIAFINIFISI